ncbi:MAG: peptidoglycan DD-metalloendopeptidase family protein [Bacteroidales bacterium]|nr:peptidoglycan DD-metalloendopeptidase family protein [Bacteroidales bacterium]
MKRILFIFVLLAHVGINCGQTRKDLEGEKQSTIKELQLAKELLGKITERKQNTMQRLAILNGGIRARGKMISNISEEIVFMDQRIDSLEQEIEMLGKTVERGKREYEKIIYSVYINHTDEEKLMYLLASESINQFYQRIKYLKYLNDYRERKVEEIEFNIIELEDRNRLLQKRKEEKISLLNEKETENLELMRERTERNSIVRRLAQDERMIRKQIREKERIRKELENRIEEMIEEEARRNASGSLLSALTPEQRLVGNNFSQNKGRLPWPVERGIVTAHYGLIDHPVLSGVKISNNGIDISATQGTKARAIFDGEVTSVFAILGANYAVLVMHGEYISVYQNLVDLKVKAGDKVKSKQEIGTIHSDPEENIAVLHLQIRRERDILNPEKWLSK